MVFPSGVWISPDVAVRSNVGVVSPGADWHCNPSSVEAALALGITNPTRARPAPAITATAAVREACSRRSMRMADLLGSGQAFGELIGWGPRVPAGYTRTSVNMPPYPGPPSLFSRAKLRS